MDFEGAALALIDDDQKDAVKSFFKALTDLYCKIIDKYIDTYKAQGFCIHDDWGSQMAPFFSPAVCEEMIVPYMRRLTDHIHSKGCIADLHSCGQIEKQVPNMIKAGWDSWSGMYMNDTPALYEAYGDKFIFYVNTPDKFDPATTSLDDQRAAAKRWADKYCNPKKPCMYHGSAATNLTPAYREELYKQSRIKFGG